MFFEDPLKEERVEYCECGTSHEYHYAEYRSRELVSKICEKSGEYDLHDSNRKICYGNEKGILKELLE